MGPLLAFILAYIANAYLVCVVCVAGLRTGYIYLTTVRIPLRYRR